MAHRLKEHEHQPDRERAGGHEGELRRAVLRIPRAYREHRHDQDERGEGGERRQRGAGALGVELQLAVTQRAEQHAQADHAGADDHDRRVQRVARERGGVRSPGEHHRDNQRHLDRRNRECEHQRPEGLADAVRDDLRVMHRRGDRADEANCAQRPERRAERRDQRDAEQQRRGDRDKKRPVFQNA